MKDQLEDNLLRLIKLSVSLGYFLCIEAGNAIRSLMGNTPAGTCVVIHYHAVAPEERNRFAAQMDILLLHAKPIAADHNEPLRPGQNHVAVTFDDGFMSAVENAIPELKQRKIPMAFFIPPGLLGTSPHWPGYGLEGGDHETIATAECLRQLPSDLISFGSHTMTHAWLPSLSDEEAKFQISASRAELKKLLNRDIKLFSFPYGALNWRLVELCREAGYERVFSVSPTPAFTDPKEFVTGRIAVNPTDWKLEFRLKILGAYQWLPRVIAFKRKLLGRHFDAKTEISQLSKETRSEQYGLN
ncbi:MAG TPA: polysaccharide deacetylase family protein [Candidatus Saccharimonadales bacterium]|jgi:peptidoglycan/xylan/chitin deacetylase (PgdA/CDA1 family)|nr:polysaccharide deacetylase family protein [Candidatus Saccharimonadales bacterium]